MAPAPQLHSIQRWMNLIGLLKYGIVFSVLLFFLPLSAVESVPLYQLLGGLFSGLTGWDIFWVSIALMAAAWSVMFTEGLIVDSVEARWQRGGAVHRRTPQVRTGYIPGCAEEFFGVPVTWRQLIAFSCLALPGLCIILWYAKADWLARIIGAATGVVVAYVVMVLLCAPARLADEGYRPLPGQCAERVWSMLSKIGPLRRFFRRLRRWLSMLLRVPIFRDLLEKVEEDGHHRALLLLDHFFAFTNVLGLVLLLAIMASVFYPGNAWRLEPPAVGYLYILITLLIWTFGALHFHLARFRISPLLVLALIIGIGYGLSNRDHYYHVYFRSPEAKPLSPVEVVKASKEGENLIVVASSGGGILAAGWTALALESFITARSKVAQEIRLLSTISGGSVGAAYYIDGLLRSPQAPLSEILQSMRLKSTSSSLGAAAYGFAFLDFWSLVSGGLLPLTDRDRGLLLEEAWRRMAAGTMRHQTIEQATGRVDGRRLSSLRGPIRAGVIPASIFGVTDMELGERLMLTPIDFDKSGSRRAQTLSEFLDLDDGKQKQEADMDLWTAARLSATFAFVSPAARAEIRAQEQVRGDRPDGYRGHHIIDGGYYDNFGVTSALDWLEPVLVAHLAADSALKFKRVLIVQLRAFRRKAPEEVKPKEGAAAALLGPLIGLETIRDGAAISRNKIELSRFITSWNDQFKGTVCLTAMTFEPPPGREGPLSWHLTVEQKEALRQAWQEAWEKPKKDEPKSPQARMQDFLAGQPGCPPPDA